MKIHASRCATAPPADFRRTGGRIFPSRAVAAAADSPRRRKGKRAPA